MNPPFLVRTWTGLFSIILQCPRCNEVYVTNRIKQAINYLVPYQGAYLREGHACPLCTKEWLRAALP